VTHRLVREDGEIGWRGIDGWCLWWRDGVDGGGDGKIRLMRKRSKVL